MSYADEKLTSAVHTLAAGRGSIQERLGDAAVYNVLNLREVDFPPDLRDDFKRLKSAITSRRAVGDEGDVAASTNAMTTEEAGEWVDLILRLQDQIAARGDEDF